MSDTDRIEAFAVAFNNVARMAPNPDEVNDELFRFARIYEGSDELRNTLTDAHISAPTRTQIIEDLLGGRAQPSTTALVAMLAGIGRIRDLPAVVDRAVRISASQASKEVAEIRTATPLSDDQRSRLAEAIGAALGKNIEVQVILDPSVIGGIVAKMGDTVIDGSVRNRLNQLRETL